MKPDRPLSGTEEQVYIAHGARLWEEVQTFLQDAEENHGQEISRKVERALRERIAEIRRASNIHGALFPNHMEAWSWDIVPTLMADTPDLRKRAFVLGT